MIHGSWPRRSGPQRIARESPVVPQAADPMIHGSWPRWTGPQRIARETPIVPQAVADGVWEEVSVWLGEELPREWRVRLMERAEAVYASNTRFRRRLRGGGNSGRDWLWTFMRHWLAALLWHHWPDWHARLPASFSVGRPLPAGRRKPEQPMGEPGVHQTTVTHVSCRV